MYHVCNSYLIPFCEISMKLVHSVWTRVWTFCEISMKLGLKLNELVRCIDIPYFVYLDISWTSELSLSFAINIHLQGFVWIPVFSSLGWNCRVIQLILCLTLQHFTFPQWSMRVPISPHPHLLFSVFIRTILLATKWLFHCGFDLHFLNVKGCWALF